MQKIRLFELTVISRFDFWKKCPPKSPFLPKFFIYRAWFLHKEFSANLWNGWLRLFKDNTWKYFSSDEDILKIKTVSMQNLCVKPKRLGKLHHVVYGLVSSLPGWFSFDARAFQDGIDLDFNFRTHFSAEDFRQKKMNLK